MRYLTLVSLALLAPAGIDAEATPDPPRHRVLVELFTSQG